jgi:hypothetical protein
LRIDGALTGNRPRAIVAVGDKHSSSVQCGGRTSTATAWRSAASCARTPRRRSARSFSAWSRRERERARRCRTVRRRQDGHDRELRRRLVRRVHAAARDGGVGRLSRQARADDGRVPRRAGRRRNVPRADLEGVHEVGAEGTGGPGRRDGALLPEARHPSTARPSWSRGGTGTSSWTTATADPRRRSSS